MDLLLSSPQLGQGKALCSSATWRARSSAHSATCLHCWARPHASLLAALEEEEEPKEEEEEEEEEEEGEPGAVQCRCLLLRADFMTALH
jgi:hypothetical protein